MKMLRHYFISDDLDDLEPLEEELERAGVPHLQIHVLSLDDTSVENHHHLHEVSALMKKDVMHAGEYGLLIGAVAAILVLTVAYYSDWTQTPAGWMPFIFLAIIVLGFFTWEGGLWGIQTPNFHFKRFEEALKAGKHVFFVDLEPSQEKILTPAISAHPRIEMAGTGTASPHWLVIWYIRIRRFFGDTMP